MSDEIKEDMQFIDFKELLKEIEEEQLKEMLQAMKESREDYNKPIDDFKIQELIHSNDDFDLKRYLKHKEAALIDEHINNKR